MIMFAHHREKKDFGSGAYCCFFAWLMGSSGVIHKENTLNTSAASVSSAHELASFITINPIGWHEAGGTFTVTGTTTIPANQTIAINVQCVHSLTQKVPTSPCDGVFGETVIIADKDTGINRWSYTVNTTGFIPDHYVIGVDTGSETTPVNDQEDFFFSCRKLHVLLKKIP